MQEALPPELAELCAESTQPAVSKVELATTPEGTWIVRAWIKGHDPDAEAALRRRFGHFSDRLRFVDDAPPMAVARPAWPGRGE